MLPTDNAWTPTHDLALLYVALAYGTDHELSQEELSAITNAIGQWVTMPEPGTINEIVLEAATAFIELDAEQEVRRAVRVLKDELEASERRRALEDVMRIAEADGVLLERERGFISMVAEAWSLKTLGQELIDRTTAVVQDEGEEWGLIYDVAILFIIVTHSADDELNAREIDAIVERLSQWQPELDEEGVRDVVREALQVYAEGIDQPALTDIVNTVKQALPEVQRLAILDDLYYVAGADGTVTEEERGLITNLAEAWDVAIRLNGRL